MITIYIINTKFKLDTFPIQSMSKVSVKKIHDIDLIQKINELSKIANNDRSDMKDIKVAIHEMRTIVNHAGLIFQTVQDVFHKTFSKLSKKINRLNSEIDEEEFSENWMKFMHKSYEVNHDDDFESKSGIIDPSIAHIPVTSNLIIHQNSWLKFDLPETITICIGKNLSITTTLTEIKELTFDYSPDILKLKNKYSRHIGPIASLDMDIERLKNHPILFKIEQNKIKSHIVYNLLLYLLLNNTRPKKDSS